MSGEVLGFTPARGLTEPIEQEGAWAPQPVWLLWRRGKSLASLGNRTATVQTPSPQPSHCNDYAVQAVTPSESINMDLSILVMFKSGSSEISVNIYQTIRRHST